LTSDDPTGGLGRKNSHGETQQWRPGWQLLVSRVIGAGLLIATGAAFILGSSEQRQPGSATHSGKLPDRLLEGTPGLRWAAGAFSALAALLLAISLAATGPTQPSASSSTALLKIAKIHGVSVVTNARGFTLYWFVPDTPTKSNCYGACAAYCPPVTGSPAAGPGVSGTLGTIRRSDGSTQLTYDQHPLYTYVGDSAPGVANGNNVTLNGGVWHEMAASG
jgi:predicted lipoprotein with Yx(FWY)xxD motif